MTKMRSVEIYRLWAGNSGDRGTWDTGFVEIPANTPDEELEEAVRQAVARIPWREEVPVITGIYSVPESGESEIE